MTAHWTTKELRTQGLSPGEIRRRVNDGRLYRLSRGLYTPTKPEPEAALRALQHRHPRLIFSGATAAGVYGLGEVTAPAQARLPGNYHPITTGALQARPSRRRRHRRVRGINVVPPVAAAATVLGQHDFWRVVRFLEGSYQGLRAAEEFSRDIRELEPRVRELLTPLLDRAVIGASSRMERVFLHDLRGVGLNPIPNFRLGPYHWDAGFREGTTVVDLDSRRFHAPDAAGHRYREFIVDRWKTNQAVQFGWAGLRYTDDCLRVTRDQVIEQIRCTVEHRRSRPGLRRVPAAVTGMHEDGVWRFHAELFD